MSTMRGCSLCAVLLVLILRAGTVRTYDVIHDYRRHVTAEPSAAPVFLSDTVRLRVVVGETVTFPCEAEIRDNVSVVWKKMDRDNNFVADVNTLDDDRFLLVNGTSLQISAVVPTDSGSYVCQITTEPAMELPHYLEVTSRPSHVSQCSGMSDKWIDLGGDYCYLIEREDNVRFIEAVYQCFQGGGSLATIPTMEEVNRIQRYLKNARGKLYIGLWKHNDGSFEWVDKNPSTFRNWVPREPNDRHETCVEVYLDSGKWNDIPCTKDIGFMCSVLKSRIAPVPKQVCPDSSSEWTDYGSKYCYIIDLYNEITSERAAERCSLAGGSLATFHSLEEVAVVRAQIQYHHDRLHIGFRQNSDGMFEWIDRSPVDLEFWAEGEPNDIEEECSEMYPNTGLWNDIPCSKRVGYICSTPKVTPQISTTEPEPEPPAEICGGVIFGENGTIQSPNYPENYNPNGNCLWNITVPDNFQIHLSFQAFQLEYGADCEFDYVKVFDGSEQDSLVLRKLCGSEDQQNVLSTGNKMAVQFSSDRVNQRSGFLAEFKAVPKCGGIIVAEEGVIHTRNYPNNYEPGAACTWKITVPENNAVLLEFKAFETEDNGDGCGNDYVEILDGHDESSRVLGRFCGYDPPSKIISSGHKITVLFMSDDSAEYFGFLAEFKKVEVSEPFPSATPSVWEEEGATCETAIDYEKGTLVSPHYPERYRSNEDCTWTIRAPPGSVIRLKFKYFNLEDSSDCRYDYVTVHDGHEISSSVLLRRLCGYRVPELITSSGNEMVVRFHSDSDTVNRGFAALFTTSEGMITGVDELQEEDDCNEHITSDEGIIHSPNYPANYGPRERCSWKITVPSDHQVVLKFNDFKVESHVRCAYDSVLVRDGHGAGSRILSKLCGHEIPSEIRSSGNKLMIEFQSDSSGEYSGFTAEFKKDLPVVPTGLPSQQSGDCGGEIHAENGTINSPNFPLSYGPLEECEWHITVPEGNLVSLKFGTVDLEYSETCRFDKVTVLDGDGTDSPVLNTICGNASPVVSSKNKLTVKFSSDDSFEGPGFSATFQKVRECGGSIVADQGVFQTPNTEDGFGYKCTWRITVPENYTVLLNIHEDEKPIFYHRAFSFQIYDGPDISSPVLRESDSLIIPKIVRSTGNEMLVMVTSDGAPGNPHFYADFKKDTCGGNLIADDGIITSPGYPNTYLPSEDCTWRITVPENYQVVLSFKTLQLENGGCNYDFVEVRDSQSSDSTPIRVCGSSLPSNIRSSSNQMSVRFVSDSSTEYQGFSAQFFKDACGGEITGETGIVSSPDFPNEYPRYSDCTWYITVPEGSTVNFRFNAISMEPSHDCQYDAVTFFDGHDSLNRKLLGKFCGGVLPDTVRSTTNKMTIKFESDGSEEGSGFTGEFSAETSPPIDLDDLENLLRQMPNIIFEQTQRKPKPSRGRKKKKPMKKRSLLDTLQARFKMP